MVDIVDMESQKLIEEIESLNDTATIQGCFTVDIDRIKRALKLAQYYHRNQQRASGEPYIIHPIAVAYSVAKAYLTTDAICAALLHDTIEDTECTESDIRFEFGERIAQIVSMLTKKRDELKISVSQIIKEAYQARDHEVLIIKLCDRVHNLETIHYLPQDRQERMAQETISDVYHISLRLEQLGLEKSMYDSLFILLGESKILSSCFTFLNNSVTFEIPSCFLQFPEMSKTINRSR